LVTAFVSFSIFCFRSFIIILDVFFFSIVTLITLLIFVLGTIQLFLNSNRGGMPVYLFDPVSFLIVSRKQKLRYTDEQMNSRKTREKESGRTGRKTMKRKEGCEQKNIHLE